MNHLRGDIDFNCRWPNGSLKPTHTGPRSELYCPSCQFERRSPNCLFTPTHKSVASGRNEATKTPRGAYSRRRSNTDRRTGGKWRTEDILERIIEYHQRHRAWPLNTTAFRASQSLPHSSTIDRHFPGGIAQAVAQAQALLQKQLNGNGKVTI